MKVSKKALPVLGLTVATALLVGCGGEEASTAEVGVTPQKMSDALYAVMEADRAVYTKQVIARLVKEEKVIKASEHFEDDKALPLPAQMFRFGSERVAENTDAFSYSLISQWPINKQNAPKTAAEKAPPSFKNNPISSELSFETITSSRPSRSTPWAAPSPSRAGSWGTGSRNRSR